MRRVVVTGGGTGIGLAIAEQFTRNGDQVTITGRREHVLKDAAARLGTLAGYCCFDASDPEAVTAALPQLPRTVDMLVNNAGGNTDFDREPPDEGDLAGLAGLAAQWRANLDANLLSAVLVTAALTPRFADNARIVSLSSIAARRGAGSYGAAKAAPETWTAAVAAELGPRGITANAVSPGLTEGSEVLPRHAHRRAQATRQRDPQQARRDNRRRDRRRRVPGFPGSRPRHRPGSPRERRCLPGPVT